MEAERLLDSMLKKKWLSSNTVRDGIIACFTLTLLRCSEQGGLSQIGIVHSGNEDAASRETQIYHKVLKVSQDAFRALNIDDEYPSKDNLIKLKSIMEQQLFFDKLNTDHPTLLTEHNRLASALLSKME